MIEHKLWVEKYRPHTIQECVLPDSLKKTFQEYVDKGEIPNLLLSGGPGIGKTTVAKAMCDEVGCDYIVISGSDEGRSIDTLRTKMTNYASSISLSGGRKVIIIDEADYMNIQSVQPALRGFIEEFSLNCSFVFTCNYKNRIMEAIQSRCANIEFRPNGSKAKMASQFFKRIQTILKLEGITYDNESVAAVITKFFPDNRRVLNELQRYSVSGTIDKGILAGLGNVQTNQLMKALKDQDYATARKWVTDNLDSDPAQLYRSLYDAFNGSLKPSSIPQMVVSMAKYQDYAKDCLDFEVNILAFLTEIMLECEFV